MSETDPPSVKPPRRRKPILSMQTTDEMRDRVDAVRDLYGDLTPSGVPSRSSVLRSMTEQALVMMDREATLAVRAVGRREGLDDAAAWRVVIARGLAASEKSHREATPRSGNSPPPAPVPESAPSGEAPPRRGRKSGP